MKLRPNTAIQKLKSYAGFGDDREKLRTSSRRRRYLEMLAAIHKPDVNLKIQGGKAYCRMVDGDTLIVIPAEEMPQKATDLDGDIWDLLCQKTQTYHELGHHLYTDWPSFEHHKNNLVEMNYESAFKHMWNVLEDAAIERILSQRFDIDRDLTVKNANIIEADPIDAPIDMFGAIMITVMEYKHPVGNLARLLDDGNDDFVFDSDIEDTFREDVLPEVTERAEAIKSENDPVERTKMIWELWDEVVFPHLPDIPHLPDDLMMMVGQMVEPDSDLTEGVSFTMPLPDDLESEVDEQIESPDEYESPQNPDELSELEEEYEEDMSKANSNDDDKDDEMEEEIESYQEAVDELSEEQSDFDPELWLPGAYDLIISMGDKSAEEMQMAAEKASRKLASELRQNLRQERRNGVTTGQRSGKIDQNRVHLSQRGETRLFKRIDKPDEKDYSCVILLDRSGSMTDFGRNIKPVIEGVGALAYAMEEVGIDVSVMSLLDDRPAVEVPFAGSVDQYGKYLFHESTAGRTPIAQALAMVRKQVEKRSNTHPFVVVVTDGEADDEPAYHEELEKCNFPVVGVSVGSGSTPDDYYERQAGYFHAITYVDQYNTLDGISQMIRRIMF